ncbi:response regulator [Noviherbaspirillum pedocola]|uniref:Response regulator transcription factor n=1 Tax=Noviherbaspirillum pedocola TaxID=2801341 RepID=A0A934SQ69_9BURK|nr:response regulator transcription factor [Noviherbaspirillum pedocola]MBK4733444.1 response regulator transcription factor [Noviherbaspirillum pedocola]
MIRIVTADDHELIREGLKKVLLPEPDIALAGEASTLHATLDLLARESIDVLVLDLSLEHGSEIQTLLTVRAAFPAVSVLVLSVHPEERLAIPALKAGAAGYVSKAMAADQVIKAIRKIGSGGRYISPRVAELLAEEVSNPPARPAHQHLTQREREVFQLLGQGMPIKHVAAQLELSISSVNTYRARIFRKMGLRSNAALIRYAVEHRLAD